MIEGLKWVDDLMRWMADLLPRWTLVRADHTGLLFRSKHVRVLDPGIRWYWPAISEVVQVPVSQQALDLPHQTLVTSDGKPVAVSGCAYFRVTNVRRFLTNYRDGVQAVQLYLRTLVREEVVAHTYAELVGNRQDLDHRLTAAAQALPTDLGVYVAWLRLTDFVPTRALALVNTGDPGSSNEDAY